ncbi:MAG: hypothetical protein WD824_12585 [Cyclobacteriaceae bacterium]
MNTTYPFWRNPHQRLALIVLRIILCFSFTLAFPQGKKVKLLVVVDASSPLTVDFRTAGNTARQVLMLGSLLDIGISEARQTSHSNKLRETVGDFDRFPIVKAGIEGAFSLQEKYFDVEVISDATISGNKTKLDWDHLNIGDNKFVLVLNEIFAGYISAYKLGTLSAQSSIKYELFDAGNKKSMEKGTISGWSSITHQFDEAVSNRAGFIAEYATAAANVIGSIYGQLNKEGHLHTMAETADLGEFVPALGDILKKYGGNFDIKMTVPKGWSKFSMGSKYTFALAPSNKDKKIFGLRLDVDLLIKELGQENLDVESYMAIFVDKVSNRGYSVDPDARPGIKYAEGSSILVFNRPNNSGKEIIIFKHYGKEYMGLMSIIFYEDFEGLITKYKSDLESAMASLSFQIQ